MTLVWADGFDHWGSAANALNCYAEIIGPFTDAGARTGSCLAPATTAGARNNMRRSLNPSNFYVAGIAAKYAASSTAQRFGFSTDNNSNFTIEPNANKGFTIRGTGITTFDSAPNLWAGDTWIYIELKVQVGTVLVAKVNGTIFANISLPANTSKINNVYCSTLNAITQVYYDDFYVCDNVGALNNDFLGNRRMRTLFATGDVAGEQDWNPNTGTTGYTQIDDVPAAANYIQGGFVGAVSRFTMGPALPANTSNIAALVVFQRSIKSDNGTATQEVSLFNSNGEKRGANFNPLDTAASYAINPDIHELDGGGFYWDYNSVNNTQISIGRVA